MPFHLSSLRRPCCKPCLLICWVAVAMALCSTAAHGQDTGTLTGIVADADTGGGLERAEVFVVGLDRSVFSDEEGAFAISGIPAGDHEIIIERRGYVVLIDRFQVAAGETTFIELAMESLIIQLPDVVVTGTSFESSPVTLPYSLTVVSRADLDERGAPQAVDFVQNLSASHGTMGRRQSWYNTSQTSTVPETVANVNLRALGASRTLVLLNSRRHAYVPFRLIGGRFVDVNTIPMIAVDRIEIVKEGASALYGSDAVAGVANFVTRSDFQGFEFTASHDYYANAGDTQVGAIAGTALGRSNVVASFEWLGRRELTALDREWALHPHLLPNGASAGFGWSFTGNPGTFLMPALTGNESPKEFSAALLSEHTPGGRMFIDPRL